MAGFDKMPSNIAVLVALFCCYLTAGQVIFTSQYSGTDVIGVAGSSIDFTWTFTGVFLKTSFGIKSGNTINDILVTVVGATGSVALRDNPSYNGRMNGSWDGKTSPGEVTFILSSIKKTDHNSFGCEITPQDFAVSTITDFVQLVVLCEFICLKS